MPGFDFLLLMLPPPDEALDKANNRPSRCEPKPHFCVPYETLPAKSSERAKRRGLNDRAGGTGIQKSVF